MSETQPEPALGPKDPGDLRGVDVPDDAGLDDPIDLGSRDAVELTTGPAADDIDTGSSADGRYPDDEP